MMLKNSLSLLIFNFYLVFINGQNHLLKYVNSGENFSPSTPAQFNSMTTPEDQMSNTRTRFANAERICVLGMWALYNTTFYGQGAEDATTVISVRGTDIETCTRAGNIPKPVLAAVQSVRYLGNVNYDEDGMVIYSQPYLLGAIWNHATLPTLPAGITGWPLGSIAITGSKSWVICGDNDTPCTKGVCVNMRNFGNRFLQRNTFRDSSLPNGWPRVVHKVEAVTLEQCSHFPNPAPVITRKSGRRSAQMGEEDGDIEINVWDASSL